MQNEWMKVRRGTKWTIKKMRHSFPLWYSLVFNWCKVRIPRGYGLTLPFILGAIKRDNIPDLLKEIRDADLQEKIIIRMCYDLNEYVLSLDEPIHPIAPYLKGYGSLLVNDKELEALISFEHLVTFLDQKYSSMVSEQKYSKNIKSAQWGPFSNADAIFIDSVTSR